MGLFSKDNKFSAELFDQACELLGLDAENTTPAELHQAMIDAGTIQGAADKAAKEAASKEVSDLKAQIATLTAEKETAEEGKETAETALAESKKDADKLQEDLTAANSALAAKVKEANTLAAEVARLTAKKAPAGTDENDDDEQFQKAPAGNGRVVKVDGLFSKLLGEEKKN